MRSRCDYAWFMVCYARALVRRAAAAGAGAGLTREGVAAELIVGSAWMW